MRRGSSERLISAAHEALTTNRVYGLTVPHLAMFPGGYLWDTAVITKGIAVYDPERAASDIVRLLEAQWTSGMIPNEVYFEHRATRQLLYGRHRDRPAGLTTSGITQPPMIVRSALEVGRRLERGRRAAFYGSVFPALKRLCHWVLAARLGRNGLAVVVHPYETGMDNRIDLADWMADEWLSGGARFDGPMRRATLATITVTRHVWGDCRTVPVGDRSSHDDVLAAYLQTRHIRRLGYDFAAIEASGRGVLVEDVGYNAILVDAFSCLREMADEITTRDVPTVLVETDLGEAMDRVADRLEDLWRDGPAGQDGGYHSRNYRTGTLSPRPTVAGLFPLLSSRIPARVGALVNTLVDPSKYWTLVPPPSAPIDSAGFVANGYWRGAAWPFPTDVLETGLDLQGYRDVAGDLRRKYLGRPHGAEHAEYENAVTGQPLGARPFSPSAALALRLAEKEGVQAALRTPSRP